MPVMPKLFSRNEREPKSSPTLDTIIGPDSVFQGMLFLKNSVYVEGSFKGRIESKSSVIVGKKGLVEADIIADHVVVNGEVLGSISALKQLDIGSTGKVQGDIEASILTMEKGALLQGFCRMITDPDGAQGGNKPPDDLLTPMNEANLLE
jgi:cytoskeletal protein CcmA (bactofilin family)